MDATTVATWAQDEAPTDATAVFPADSVPASNTGSDLTATSYDRASITYINADGTETNRAGPGGAITTTEYDDYGNTVTELTAANRELALGTSSGAADELASLGLTDLSTADRAQLLSSVSGYSTDGERLTDEYGPLHEITLTEELTGTTADSTLAAGTAIPAHAHTAYTYDENKPTDAAVSNLVTSAVTGAAIPGYATDAETHTVTTTYDWSTGQELKTVGGDTTDIVATYDGAGRVATTRTAGSTGSDAAALNYSYYSASSTGTCASIEWDGLLCRTAPAATITGGGSNPANAVTTVYTYDRWGRPAVKTETSGSVTRTTTNTVDSTSRTTNTAVTGGIGTDTPATTYTYNTSNGQLASLTSNGQTVTYTYDSLGRRIGYSDGAGNTSTTAHDVLDRKVKTTDSAPSTVTYAYATTGDLKTVTDSVAGTFTGTYNADGALISETLPGSYTLTVATDPAGQETDRAYTAADGTTLLADSATYTVTGQQAGHTQTDGSTTRSDYTYDSAGRLTQASDTTSTGCTTRAYTFDVSSNRTALTATSDDCDTTTTDDDTTATTSYTHDSANRLVNSGYAYDAFGRTTTAGTRSLTYFTNDLVRTETVGTDRGTWALDAAGRLAVRSAQTQATDGTWSTTDTITNHYGDDGDRPVWTSADGTVGRSVQDLSGSLAAQTTASGGTVLQLANIHGDVIVQQSLDANEASTVQHYDEYGQQLDATTAATYGYLGAYARSTSGVSGLSYLGARAYDPTLGRFLQTDPVYGANANSYVYPGDPVGSYDLDGRKKARSCGFWCSLGVTLVGSLAAAACAPFAGPIICGAVGGGITGFARYWWTHHGGHGYTIKGAIKATLIGAAIGGFGGAAGKLIKKIGGKVFKGWGDRQAIKDWDKFKKALG